MKVFRLKEYSVLEKKIISGNMVPVLAVLVLRFITTVEKNTAVESPVVRLAVSVTAISRFGIMYLLSLKMTGKATIQNWKIKTLIPVWD